MVDSSLWCLSCWLTVGRLSVLVLCSCADAGSKLAPPATPRLKQSVTCRLINSHRAQAVSEPATLHAPHLPPSGTTVVTQRGLRSASLPFSRHLSVSPVRLWALHSCFVAGVLFKNFIVACHIFAVPKERTRLLELQLLLNRPPPRNNGFHIWSVIPHHTIISPSVAPIVSL